MRAPFFLVQQLLPIMCKGSGVIFMSSFVARSAGTPLAAYAATKGAIEALMLSSPPRSAARASGSRGGPGVVDTDCVELRPRPNGSCPRLGPQVFQRIATPDDV